jgi:hypothetical protein
LKIKDKKITKGYTFSRKLAFETHNSLWDLLQGSKINSSSLVSFFPPTPFFFKNMAQGRSRGARGHYIDDEFFLLGQEKRCPVILQLVS